MLARMSKRVSRTAWLRVDWAAIARLAVELQRSAWYAARIEIRTIFIVGVFGEHLLRRRAYLWRPEVTA